MAGGLHELTMRIEQVSALYAERCSIRRDDEWYVIKLQEELGELVAEYARATGRGRRGDRSDADIRAAMSDEAADLFAHVLLFCHHNGLDLDSALRRKWFSHLDNNEDR